MLAHNPILKGFYPDPSVIRVGEDFYLANSTFFWWPGVALHHSRDLVQWECLPSPLQRESQLDLRGVSAAGGVWAPDLSWYDGVFYLLYTNVRSMYTWMYDTENYLVTAQDIRGPWSDPVPLSNYGFDPSLFHDEDGRKYMISMVTDHRIPKRQAGKLIIQEYDAKKQCLVGDVHEVYSGDQIYLEGPHLYRHGGYYYIFAADTGTGEGHGQSLLRSENIFGPYEMYRADFMVRTQENEAYSVLTTRHTPKFPIQKCGHCSLIDNGRGDWYALHLCGRPSQYTNPSDAARFPGARRYPLGRETAIQKMEWTADGWLTLAGETQLPSMEVETGLPQWRPEGTLGTITLSRCGVQKADAVWIDDFAQETLALDYIFPYTSQEGYALPGRRKGYLRLIGREGVTSRFGQTMVCRRWTQMSFAVETKLDFSPHSFKQLAGLILLYDLDNFLYLHVTYDEEKGRCVSLYKAENRRYECLADAAGIPEDGEVLLRMEVRDCIADVMYAMAAPEAGNIHWQKAAEGINVSFLSDEACSDGWFSGAVYGICCQDLTGGRCYADFDYLCEQQ